MREFAHCAQSPLTACPWAQEQQPRAVRSAHPASHPRGYLLGAPDLRLPAPRARVRARPLVPARSRVPSPGPCDVLCRALRHALPRSLRSGRGTRLLLIRKRKLCMFWFPVCRLLIRGK